VRVREILQRVTPENFHILENIAILHWAIAAGWPSLFSMPAAPVPDPRFNEFVLLQAQNAGLFLGCIPDPRTGQANINLRAAKSVLDALDMIEVKSRGNLTENEHKLLETTLKNIRSLYQKSVVDSQASDDAS